MTETATTPEADVHERVKAYYGEELQGSEDLKTNACCATGAPPALVRLGARSNASTTTSAQPLLRLRLPHRRRPSKGATVLDLGCGTGRDVYVLSSARGRARASCTAST